MLLLQFFITGWSECRKFFFSFVSTNLSFLYIFCEFYKSFLNHNLLVIYDIFLHLIYSYVNFIQNKDEISIILYAYISNEYEKKN
jgi:hypothetical protein